MGLFTAAQQAAKPAESKAKKATIRASEAQFPGIGETVKQFLEAKAQIASATGIKDATASQLTAAGSRLFLEQYDKLGRRPDSFTIEADNGTRVMVVPMDTWRGITDKATADMIKNELRHIPLDLIEEKTVFGFNPEVLNKYLPQIEKALESLKIPDEDKAALLTASIKYSIRKGTLDQLGALNPDQRREVVECLSPTFSLRDPK